jgi:hypothetical protein
MDLHRRNLYSTIASIIEIITKHNFNVFCQSPVQYVNLARNTEIDWTNEEIIYQRKLWKKEENKTAFTNLLRSRFVTYFSIGEWMEQLTKYNLSLGTRFHGNLLALQSGIPALFIGHDTRTSELIETIKVPRIDSNVFNCSNIADIFQSIQFDYEAFDRERFRLACKYKDILLGHGLKLNQNLIQLTETKQ